MKTEQDEILTYNDEDAVKFILDLIPAENREHIDEDTITYVLDVVYDYYDENGLIEDGATEEASIDEDELLKYVIKATQKDNVNLSEDEVQLILDGEYEYGKSLGIYSEEEED